MENREIWLSFTLKVVIMLLAFVIAPLLIVGGSKIALAASLKSYATLDGDVLTAGDIFGGLSEEKASYVLGPAPQPDQEMTLNARTLMRVAAALDLAWRPVSYADQITITRTATIITSRMIEDSLQTALQEKGLSGKFELKFQNPNPKMILDKREVATLDIVSLELDRGKDWFQAELVAPSSDKPLQRIQVNGRVDRLIDMPVLKQAMRNGDVIYPSDIEMISVPTRSLQDDYILDAASIVSMTPQRIIHAGKPVRANELEQPQLVGRGDQVVIMYKEGPLTLSAKGRTLRSGAKGELIQVVNTSSNRKIDAVIHSAGLVYAE